MVSFARKMPNIKIEDRVDGILYLECPRDNAWFTPGSIARATLLNILCVVRCDNILAGLRMVHNGFSVREESIEEPVEDTSGEEGVDVTDSEPAQVENISMFTNSYEKRDGLQVLTTCRDVDRAPSCDNDIVDEARKRRCTANEECSNCAPIRSKLR